MELVYQRVYDQGRVVPIISADWTAPRIQQLDPQRETAAQVDRIKAGLATISETIREMGREPEEFFKEYKQDIDRLAELGITIDSVNTAATVVQKENSNGKTGNE